MSIIGKRPCRGWFAFAKRIVDINVTTMHSWQLLKPLRQRQVLDAPEYSDTAGQRCKTDSESYADLCRL